MPNGTVKKIVADKGYGFIAPADGGKDIFFHATNCLPNQEAFDSFEEGNEVTFSEGLGRGDKPQAQDVQQA